MVAGPPSASAKTTVVRQLSQRSKSVAVGAPKAGGAAAGKAGGGAATKTPTATSSSSATTRPARQSSIDFRGDAHKLYSQYASRSDGVIIKRQLVGLMKGLQKKGKFKFSSEERLKAFVDREFAKHDINADGKLSFEEFIEFYARWFDENAQAMVDAHQMQACRVETAFMRYDTNHDFQITSDELRHLVEEMQPSGMPKPPEAELQACVDELMKLDVNRNGGISFEEFSVGYNAMIDRIGALHAEQRRKVMEGHVGFRGMIKDESERQALEKATSHRYDGKVWVVSESELAGARERAHAAGKFALFLDAPPGELDLPTARYAAKMGARCKVLNIQQLVMHLAEKSMTADEARAPAAARPRAATTPPLPLQRLPHPCATPPCTAGVRAAARRGARVHEERHAAAPPPRPHRARLHGLLEPARPADRLPHPRGQAAGPAAALFAQDGAAAAEGAGRADRRSLRPGGHLVLQHGRLPLLPAQQNTAAVHAAHPGDAHARRGRRGAAGWVAQVGGRRRLRRDGPARQPAMRNALKSFAVL